MAFVKLIVASGNLGKVKEFEQSLAQFKLQLLPKPAELEVEETGTTFLENAHLKATQIAIATGEWALADDSGLAVDALNGAPGIYSARYGKNDAERINRLLTELGNNPHRQAQFVCAIAIANPQGKIVAEAVGICKGEILFAPQGDSGFGYDPVFYLPEHQLTFAQMPTDLKAQYSHRGQALAILLPQLQSLIGRD
jgi:XTP/dITP diphosphohydrolase